MNNLDKVVSMSNDDKLLYSYFVNVKLNKSLHAKQDRYYRLKEIDPYKNKPLYGFEIENASWPEGKFYIIDDKANLHVFSTSNKRYITGFPISLGKLVFMFKSLGTTVPKDLYSVAYERDIIGY